LRKELKGKRREREKPKTKKDRRNLRKKITPSTKAVHRIRK
jgi:hypothetical protein